MGRNSTAEHRFTFTRIAQTPWIIREVYGNPNRPPYHYFTRWRDADTGKFVRKGNAVQGR